MDNINIVLFDAEAYQTLLPLTFTRPVSELRVGITTITEKWERTLNKKISYYSQDYLSEKYPLKVEKDNLLINGSVLPTEKLINNLKDLKMKEILICGGNIIAIRMDESDITSLRDREDFDDFSYREVYGDKKFLKINNLWDLFQKNGEVLQDDFEKITKGRKSAPLSKSNTVIGNGNIFLEEGAKVEASILNTTQGDIYIGKNAEIMEGCLVRGPFALGEHSVLKMGAKIYGATTIGKHCKVGGEVSNSIFISYSNKAHDGFLGNAVIGEWCNIGADANNSNLKNNYSNVKIWNYEYERFKDSGSQFCGLFMGDHSKVGINTMFNTGTVVGVSANIFGGGFPRVFIPSFSWGGSHGFSTYKIDKSLETAKAMMNRRGIDLNDKDIDILNHIYSITSKYRRWENN